MTPRSHLESLLRAYQAHEISLDDAIEAIEQGRKQRAAQAIGIVTHEEKVYMRGLFRRLSMEHRAAGGGGHAVS